MTPTFRRILSVLLLLGLVGTTNALPAQARVDDYSGYEPETHCASAAKPGTRFLMEWLLRQYPGTGSASMLRACSSSTSEHQDGRALDWAVDATDAADRARVDALLSRLFAADGGGNEHALARRMGIMYLIWNDYIYSAYSGFAKRDYVHSVCPSRNRCSKTLRHRDHVHISLSRSGAAAQTTFYRSRRVPSEPVLVPGTIQLDGERTAITEVTVPADGSVVRTDFKVTGDTTYRVVADGLYRTGARHRIADPACVWDARANRWAPFSNGLRVNGRTLWDAAGCNRSHTHVAEYRAGKSRFLNLQITDPRPGDNDGSVRFYVLREDIAARAVATRPVAARPEPRAARRPGPTARRLVRETVTVPAKAARGRSTARSLTPRRAYRVEVRGTAHSGETGFDANCVRYRGALHSQHSLDLFRPEADHLQLQIQGVPVKLRVPGSSRQCSGGHRYVGTFRPVVHGKARVKVWDPYRYADNTGSFRVTLRRR